MRLPVRTSADFLGPFGPLLRLPHAGFEHLVPVELGVFCEQAVRERGDELGRRPAAVQEAVRLVAGFVDHALHVEAMRERVEAAGRRVGAARAAGTLRKRSR